MPKEQDKNQGGQSANSITFLFRQAITEPQNAPRTLQAHCQAQTAVKVIEKPFIGLAKELTIPSHVSPKGLLGFPDAQNKLCFVSGRKKNAFMVNLAKN